MLLSDTDLNMLFSIHHYSAGYPYRGSGRSIPASAITVMLRSNAFYILLLCSGISGEFLQTMGIRGNLLPLVDPCLSLIPHFPSFPSSRPGQDIPQ